jgi:hypothetical protein
MRHVPTWLWVALLLAGMFAAAWFYPGRAQAPVIGQGGASPGPPMVFRGPHALAGGGQPTITGCGTPGAPAIPDNAGVGGTDTAGNVVLARDYAPTGFCHVKFNTPFLVDPACAVTATVNTEITTLVGPIYVSVDADEIIITNGTPHTLITWICIGLSWEGPGNPGPFTNPPRHRGRAP